jgi:dynein light chain 1, axonemal
MVAPTTVTQAIAQFEAQTSSSAATAERVLLFGRNPPLKAVDAQSLSILTSCRHLSLSSNSIDRLSVPALPNLRVLSVGRNMVRKLDGIDPVASTLEELWISYNLLEKLTGIENFNVLRVLYASNNKLKDWGEIDRLSGLPDLEELLLLGNPIANDPNYRNEILKRLPNLKKLDGELIIAGETLQGQN